MNQVVTQCGEFGNEARVVVCVDIMSETIGHEEKVDEKADVVEEEGDYVPYTPLKLPRSTFDHGYAAIAGAGAGAVNAFKKSKAREIARLDEIDRKKEEEKQKREFEQKQEHAKKTQEAKTLKNAQKRKRKKQRQKQLKEEWLKKQKSESSLSPSSPPS